MRDRGVTILWRTLLTLGIGAGCTPTLPFPLVSDVPAGSATPLDGLWQSEYFGVIVHLDRGRLYLHSNFGPQAKFGQVLLTDIKETKNGAEYSCMYAITQTSNIHTFIQAIYM
jgi:hypothetical protein